MSKIVKLNFTKKVPLSQNQSLKQVVAEVAEVLPLLLLLLMTTH